MITGNKLSLRALEEDDLIMLRDWRNKEHYRKYFREYRELNMDMQKSWFDKFVVKDTNTLMFGILEKSSNNLIGACGLCYINWVHNNADLSIYIGKDNIYIDPDEGGYAWETMDLLFNYGFNELNLHKVWTEIYAFDEMKHKLFEKYGFHLDGVLRDNYFYDGAYQDSNIFSILAADWRKKHYSKNQ